MGADARLQAHVRRADRAAGARRGDARGGALEPDLPAALQLRRRLAGVHRDRQALRARPGGRLRPAGARHAAVAQRARLPRRAGPPERASSRAARSRCSCGRRVGGRMLGRGTGVVFGLLERLTGVDLLHDLSVFFRALGGMVDGFTERARRVGALLEDPGHDVPDRHRAAPRPGRGGDLLPPQAARRHMPFGGLVVNRMHTARRRPTARCPPSSARTSPAGSRPPRTSWPRSPSARRRASSACGRSSATRRRSWCLSSTATSTTSRGSR